MPKKNPESVNHQIGWARQVTKVLAFAEQQQLQVVGIVSDRSTNDVGVLALDLARAYQKLDRTVLFVDAQALALDPPSDDPMTDYNLSLAQLNAVQDDGVTAVTLSKVPGHLASVRESINHAFAEAKTQHQVIVVQLPAMYAAPGEAAAPFVALGAVCDSIYLVCVTGQTKRGELQDSVALCKLHGLKLGGLIMNDEGLPGSNLLADE